MMFSREKGDTMGLIFWLVAAPVFLLMLAVYVWGVRKEQSWGLPVFLLLFAALIGWVGYGVFGGGASLQTAREGANETATALGEALRDELENGSRVLIICPVNTTGDGELQQQWKKGLVQGLGDDSLEVIDYRSPQGAVPATLSYPGNAEGFSEALAGVSGRIDAIISFTGLPSDLSAFRIYNTRGDKPAVAAYVGKYGNVRAIRSWLEQGYLQAVAMTRNGRLETYGPNNLPPLE